MSVFMFIKYTEPLACILVSSRPIWLLHSSSILGSCAAIMKTLFPFMATALIITSSFLNAQYDLMSSSTPFLFMATSQLCMPLGPVSECHLVWLPGCLLLLCTVGMTMVMLIESMFMSMHAISSLLFLVCFCLDSQSAVYSLDLV